MDAGLVILIVLGVPVVLVLIFVIGNYNRLVSLRQHIRESWADVDVELKRRHDLIPNLVEVVKGYAKHEQQVLERVVELRNTAVATESGGTFAAVGRSESELMAGVGRLFAVAEAYPQLKADAQFLELQKELALTEDRIAAARRLFNGNVRDFNQACLTVPSNIVAGAFGFEPQTFFELTTEAERVVPRVGI
jgi:LemA protein